MKICLIGYGRMGKAIHELLESEGCELGYIVNNEADWNEEKISSCDVAIEFSVPSMAYKNISRCIELEIPVVSGTTGWLDKMHDLKSILHSKANGAFLYGSNFSLGMNLFFSINEYVSQLMEVSDYSVEITEIHHTSKLDKPSGTAISLAEGIIETRTDKKEWINDSTNDSAKVGIISIREPDVPGTHKITYENEQDLIEIEHTAKSRKGFALGAIKAAKWLKGKQGFFTIRDYVDSLLKK